MAQYFTDDFSDYGSAWTEVWDTPGNTDWTVTSGTLIAEATTAGFGGVYVTSYASSSEHEVLTKVQVDTVSAYAPVVYIAGSGSAGSPSCYALALYSLRARIYAYVDSESPTETVASPDGGSLSADTDYWIRFGIDASGDLYGAIWEDGVDSEQSPWVSWSGVTPTNALTGTWCGPIASTPAVLQTWDMFAVGTGGDEAPSSAPGGGTTVTVPQANLTFSTTAPTVDVPAVGIDITPAHADLALSTEAPDVARTDNRDLTVSHADLALSTEAPTVDRTANVALEVGAADLALTTEAPTAEATDNRAITVGHADLALTSEAPDVLATAAGTIIVGQADLVLSSEAPSVEQTTNAALTIDHADLALSTTAPEVFASDNIGISPAAASLLLSTVAPDLVIANNQAIIVPQANLALSSEAPTIERTANANIAPAAADLALSGFAPSVDYSGTLVWTPISEASTTWTAITEASTTWTEI